MRQGLRILVAATLEACLAALLDPPWMWVVGYIALVTGLVGLCAMAGWPHLLAKRLDGTVPWWSLVVFWPWHGMTRAILALRRLGSEPLTAEIHPGWLLGGWPHDRALWSQWPAVVDLTCELPRRGPEQPYLCLPTWDGTAPRQEDIRRGVAFAVEQRAKGRSVLVHCAAGHGRSATVLAAALVEAGLHATWQEAVAHMRSVRPGVGLVTEQRAALHEWAAASGGEHGTGD